MDSVTKGKRHGFEPKHGSNCAGPVVDKVKSEASRTGDEIQDLKNTKASPSTTTATGQQLTRMYLIMRL